MTENKLKSTLNQISILIVFQTSNTNRIIFIRLVKSERILVKDEIIYKLDSGFENNIEKRGTTAAIMNPQRIKASRKNF